MAAHPPRSLPWGGCARSLSTTPAPPTTGRPVRFLWWMAKGQARTLLGGMIVRHRLDVLLGGDAGGDRQGDRRRESPHVTRPRWSSWAGRAARHRHLVGAAAGIIRHRFAVTNWLTAAYRTVQLVARHATHLGATLSKKVATGEVVAIGTNDLAHMGNLMDVSARAAGALVSFVVVAVILLQTSSTLGLVVLVGVPLLLLAIGPMLRPLQRRNMRAARDDGPARQPRHRHRRRSAGAARDRRRAGLPRALRRGVAEGPPGRRRGWPGCSPCSTRCRCCCPASSW